MSKENDIVVFLDNVFAQYVHYSECPVVLHIHNVEGWSAAAIKPEGMLYRTLHRSSLRQIRNVEGRAVRAAQAVTVTSKEESVRLATLYGVDSKAIVPSGVDVPDTVYRDPQRHVVAWLGTHAYGPNSVGLYRFIVESWPSVYDATFADFWIIGRDPPRAIQELDGTKGIRVLGYVEDLTSLFSLVSVGVVPLWEGAGVKLKTITMMANGVPIVSTTDGAEGINHWKTNALVVADSPKGISIATIDLLNNSKLAEMMGRRARALVLQEFSWKATGSILSSTISDIYASSITTSDH